MTGRLQEGSGKRGHRSPAAVLSSWRGPGTAPGEQGRSCGPLLTTPGNKKGHSRCILNGDKPVDKAAQTQVEEMESRLPMGQWKESGWEGDLGSPPGKHQTQSAGVGGPHTDVRTLTFQQLCLPDRQAERQQSRTTETSSTALPGVTAGTSSSFSVADQQMPTNSVA